MNALSALPVNGWGEEEEISSIWDAVIAIVASNSGVCSCFLCMCKYTLLFTLCAYAFGRVGLCAYVRIYIYNFIYMYVNKKQAV